MVELIAKSVNHQHAIGYNFSNLEYPIKVDLKSKLLMFLKSEVLRLGHETRLLG